MHESEIKRVTVIGMGYVGLPLAVHCANSGYKVYGLDSNADLVIRLNSGQSHIPDISEESLRRLIQEESIVFTIDTKMLSLSSVVVICVPTPIGDDKFPDLGHLEDVIKELNLNCQPGTLIISESTSFPGTLRKIVAGGLDSNLLDKVFLAVAPERVSPGDGWSVEDVPRVVGAINDFSRDLAVEFYASLGISTHEVSSPEIAEFSKLLENSFRLVNISLINELQDLAYRSKIDLREAILAASTKPFGFMPFHPSVGVGGHCIPVDPQYLQYFARSYNCESTIIASAAKLNDSMGEILGQRILSYLVSMGLPKKTGLIVGVTYKANIPDTRESPSLKLKQFLSSRGIQVNWHDPLASSWENEKSEILGENTWDFAVICQPHEEIDIYTLIKQARCVFDCTGKYKEFTQIVQV
jgi:UDP-N-acetyl-D-glucosamine dehydrogenase